MTRFLAAVATVVAALTVLAVGEVQAIATYGDCPFTGTLDGVPVNGEFFVTDGIASLGNPGEVNRGVRGVVSWNDPYGFDGFVDYDPIVNAYILSGQASNPNPVSSNVYNIVVQGLVSVILWPDLAR